MVHCIWAFQTEDKFVSNSFGNTHGDKKLQKKKQEKDSSVRETENRYDNVTLWTPNNTEKKQKTENKGIGN